MIVLKFFAWLLFGWALLFRRGKGIVIRKSGDAPKEPRTSGPGWKLVSTKTYGLEDSDSDAAAEGQPEHVGEGHDSEPKPHRAGTDAPERGVG